MLRGGPLGIYGENAVTLLHGSEMKTSNLHYELETILFTAVCADPILFARFELGREVGASCCVEAFLLLGVARCILSVDSVGVPESELLAFKFGLMHEGCCRRRIPVSHLFEFMQSVALSGSI